MFIVSNNAKLKTAIYRNTKIITEELKKNAKGGAEKFSAIIHFSEKTVFYF